ncbi:MAG TPA: DUF1566 domain-containing protein [bacterium]|nr:DUF1566 domain-containing protein [bacterium]
MIKRILLMISLVFLFLSLFSAEKDRLAVMDVADEAKLFNKTTIANVTDYIFTKLQGTKIYWMVPKADRDTALEQAIEETVKGSRKECVDEKCQLSLVAQLQANFLINTKIKKLYEGTCNISISKFDVEKRAGVDSWTTDFNCSEKGVFEAINGFDFLKKSKLENKKEKETKEDNSDKNACIYAREKNSLEIWEKYISKYPKGECAFQALEEIRSKKGKEWSKIVSTKMNWSDAKNYCESDGWRLPTISELRTLVKNCPLTQKDGECKINDECLSDSCESQACKGCMYSNDGRYSVFKDSEYLWSSSVVQYKEKNAWYLGFGDGASIYNDPKSSKHKFRCVK